MPASHNLGIHLLYAAAASASAAAAAGAWAAHERVDACCEVLGAVHRKAARQRGRLVQQRHLHGGEAGWLG